MSSLASTHDPSMRHESFVKPMIETSAIEKFLMCSSLRDPASVEDEDQVGFANRAQPMCNHDAGSIGEQPLERSLNADFGECINGAGRFVEN